jgi:hypothetical protein
MYQHVASFTYLAKRRRRVSLSMLALYGVMMLLGSCSLVLPRLGINTG